MARFRLVPVSLLILIALTAQTELTASDLKFKAGVGYDFVSQEYFLDSVTTDTTLSIWSLKTNYLDDFKGRLSLTYVPWDDRRLEIRSSYEQTPEIMRILLATDWRQSLGSARIAFNGELEARQRYRDSAQFGDSFIYGYATTAFSAPLSEQVISRLRLLGEFVRFDSTTDYSYNYYRYGPKLSIARTFDNFSYAELAGFLTFRDVPDLAELDYIDFGLEASALAFFGSSSLDLFLRAERKEYNRSDNQGDHFRLDLAGSGRFHLGGRQYLKLKAESEILLYSLDDPVNFDYGRTGWSILLGHEHDGWSLGLGPDFELMYQQKGDLVAEEDYFEAGGKIETEYLKLGRLYVSAESVLGHRNLYAEDEFQTDFLFERLNLIGDIGLTGSLNLNFLFSAEWEWHQLQRDNSRIVLLSSNLTYTF